MRKLTRGASALSYGLIVGLISVVALAAVTTVGSSNKALMTEVGTTLTGVTESTSTSQATPETPAGTAASCLDILNAGNSTGNGDYTIDRGSGDETVFCDMAGGGWTWPLDDATSFGETVLYIETDSTNNASFSNQSAGAATVSFATTSYNTTQAVFGTDSLFVEQHLDISGLPSLTGDFTLDFWVRVSSTGIDSLCAPIVTFGSHGDSGAFTLFNCTSTLSNIGAGPFLGADSWGDSGAASDGSIGADTWRHVAVTRQGSTLRVFIDGAVNSTVTYSTAISATPMRLAKRTDNTNFQMDLFFEEVRLINGTARWTSNFTPPTEPYRFQ